MINWDKAFQLDALLINIKCKRLLTAYKQYCLAAGATQGNIAYTQTVMKIRSEQSNQP